MIFVGLFTHVTNQEQTKEEDRRHGEFSLMAYAETPEQAVQMFRKRIVEYRNDQQFFEGACKIFLTQLLEFDRLPQNHAFMLNFKSVAGDPIMPFISCTVPTDQNDYCSIHDWRDNQPAVDGKSEQLFVAFKERLPSTEEAK
ncbi:MAG: hypothetical protein QNI95_11750 [Desulfobacterales bacterium]|nr:hypothetical protein [Desulfobacterales bacterium]